MHSTPPSTLSHLARYQEPSGSRAIRIKSHPALTAIWLVFRVPKGSRMRDKKARIRCLDRPAECSFWNPSGSDRRDPNKLAPNGSKLGRLQHARQGLVRVPESNTKYGGKLGKTGGPGAPLLSPSISESSGIPKRKKSTSSLPAQLRPAVHRQTIYCGQGLALERLKFPASGSSGQACRAGDGQPSR